MEKMRVLVFAVVCAVMAITVAAVYETKSDPNNPMLLDLREDEYLFAGAPDCGGNKITDISATTADFKSQAEPQYQNNQKLCWKISPINIPATSRVKLWFTKVEMEKGYDFVRVYDLAENNKIVDDEADTQTSYFSKKGFLINMVTDQDTVAAGFVLRFAVEAADSGKPTTDEIVLNTFLDQNHALCNTKLYRNGGQLILRRGCTFKLALSNKAVPSAFKFTLDETSVSYSFSVPVEGTQNGVTTKKITDGANVAVQLTLASDFPIGKYKIAAVVGTSEVKGASAAAYVVFNPYSDKDPAYISKREWQQEYIENENGAVYTGSTYSHGQRPWNFDHFSMNVLRTTMKLIAPLTPDQRTRPDIIARRLSNQGNDVLLWGQWQEPYDDGVKPWDWTGSAEIFKKFVDTGKQVKYGQCWVFAGTLTSMCRSIGIGTRPVTNFDSAHEHKPFDQICEEYADEKGNIEYGRSKDSVWNFHVWVEGWFTRPDLKQPAEWNAYDSTAQEESDNLYQCGPAYIPFLKQGDYKSKFDNDFIAGETRCAIRTWVKQNGKYVQDQINYCRVGKITATKKVGSMTEENVASHYKTDPAQCVKKLRFMEVAPSSQTQFKSTIPKQQVQVGQPVPLSVDVTTGSAPTEVTVNVVVFMTQSNGDILRAPSKDPKKRGDPLPPIVRFQQTLKLQANQQKNIPVTVNVKDYLPYLGRTVHMAINFVASTKDGQHWVDNQRFSLVAPTLKITPPSGFVVGEVKEAQITFTNPLDVALKNGILKVSVTGHLATNQNTLKVETIPPRGTKTIKAKIKSSVPGSVSVQATLSTSELIDVSGHTTMQVQAAPKSRLAREKRVGADGRQKLGPTKEAVGRKDPTHPITKLVKGEIKSSAPAGSPPPPTKGTKNNKKGKVVGGLSPSKLPKVSPKQSQGPAKDKLSQKLSKLNVKEKSWMKTFKN